MFRRLFARESRADRAAANALYAEIVAAARQPAFYSRLGVEDTPLGRFEMIALHIFLVMRRLRDGGERAAPVAQVLVDEFFLDVEHSLRELGIGDMGVPKRMKKLARMFYGRTGTYGDALDRRDREALADALARNIRPGVDGWHGAPALADHALATDAVLSARPLDAILESGLALPPLAD